MANHANPRINLFHAISSSVVWSVIGVDDVSRNLDWNAELGRLESHVVELAFGNENVTAFRVLDGLFVGSAISRPDYRQASFLPNQAGRRWRHPLRGNAASVVL